MFIQTEQCNSVPFILNLIHYLQLIINKLLAHYELLTAQNVKQKMFSAVLLVSILCTIIYIYVYVYSLHAIKQLGMLQFHKIGV